MSSIVNGSQTIQHDSLAIIPLGGQGELGQLLWVLSHSGVILLVDAGAAYPSRYLPGVDLLLPNTNFLEANQEKIAALLLTNGHEEHSGAVPYLLRHLNIPRILAPRFVSQLLTQSVVGTGDSEAVDLTACLDTIEFGKDYEIGPFNVEWLPVNNAIADASGLKIESPNGTIVYTSSFKLDQTPVDGHQLDIHRFARAGEKGVTLLISDSVSSMKVIPLRNPLSSAISRTQSQMLPGEFLWYSPALIRTGSSSSSISLPEPAEKWC